MIGQVYEALLTGTSAHNERLTSELRAATLWLQSVVMPASLRQSSLDHVQLLCSHVGNNSRVKLLFCLIFLANLHIQAIFCLLPLFAIPFCQGTVCSLFCLRPKN